MVLISVHIVTQILLWVKKEAPGVSHSEIPSKWIFLNSNNVKFKVIGFQ